MAYLIPYSESFRGIRYTEPVYTTAREHEARVLIPQIAGQVSQPMGPCYPGQTYPGYICEGGVWKEIGGGWDWLTNLLGGLGDIGKNILTDEKKLNALTGLIAVLKGQNFTPTTGQQQQLQNMGFTPEMLALLLGSAKQHQQEIPEPSFMQKYGGWLIGGGLGLATLAIVLRYLKTRKS